MNAKKKLIEYLLVITLYLFICIVLYASAAQAAITDEYYPENQTDVFRYNGNLIYKVQTVSMYQDINYITETLNITCYQAFPVTDNMVWHWQKFQGLYNLSNITVTDVPASYTAGNSYTVTMRATKDPEEGQSAILVYPSFLGFNLYNHTWFNPTYEKRTTYNMSNIEYRKVVNMSNGDGIVPYNKSDRWFDHNTGEQLQIFNYTLIGGQPFVHIRGNLNGNTQWDKYVNLSNSYPGVENASLTYNFYDNISKTGTFNTTDKWFINQPFMTVVVVDDHLELTAFGNAFVGRTTVMWGNENLTQFSNIIYTWNPGAIVGTGGGLKRQDYSVFSYALGSAWERNDNVCFTGTEIASSSSVCVIPTSKTKSEVNRTPYWNRFYLNDSLLVNKTTDIYNGQQVVMFTPDVIGVTEYVYSVIAYNRSANATFTPYQTLTYNPMNFTSWSNNRTLDQSLSLSAPINTIIRFNASTSVNCDNCSWYVNGTPYTNFTLLKDTSLNYSFTSIGNYNINLIAFNNTFSNSSYLNWTVAIFSNVMLDGFVNNTLGAYVNGVQVNLTDSTGSSTITWTQNHLLGNITNLAPTIEPSSPGTGERLINVTYWANNSDVEVLAFAHAMSVSETAGVFVYIDNTLVAGQSGRPLAGAETAFREITITIPRYSSYRINFTNYHHYEWRESPHVNGYYRFPAVNVGNYNITFRQVGYDNLTAPMSLATNTRYNATISPVMDDDTEPMSMALLGFIIGLIALALIVKHRKILRHDGVH